MRNKKKQQIEEINHYILNFISVETISKIEMRKTVYMYFDFRFIIINNIIIKNTILKNIEKKTTMKKKYENSKIKCKK